MNQKLFVAVVSMILFGAGLAVAETHYVSPASATQVPPYTDFSTASHTIQPAINVSHNGDTVMVSATTYPLTAQLMVTNGIVLTSTIDRDAILDGQNDTYRVLTISHSNAVVEGFTIKNGDADGDSGGGVLLSTGRLVNCWVVSNSCSLEAAGISIIGSGEVTNCNIEHNSGDMFGGGVCCRDGGLIANCVINNNGVHGGWGGGVACIGGGAVVGSWISNNWGHTRGGGVYISNDGLVDRCTINCNTSDAGGGVYLDNGGFVNQCTINCNTSQNGGGVYLDAGGIVSNTHVFANTAQFDGGGVFMIGGGEVINSLVSSNFANGGWPTGGKGGGILMDGAGQVHRCDLVGNHANDRGGAVTMYTSGFMDNCVIRENVAAYYGGGVDCDQGGDVQYCTIVGNRAVGNSGGGMHLNNGGYVMDTIIWSNSAPSSPNCFEEGAGFQFYYCCTTPLPSVGDDNITDDPQLHGTYDQRLKAGSPCIDTAGVLAPLTDRRGVARPLEGNGDSPACADRGAYEYIDPLADTDGDGHSDRMEIWAGTDPTDPNSYMAMMRPDKMVADLHIRWASVAGKLYMVKRSLNLMNGFTETVESNLVATPPDNVYTGALLSGAASGMFRIELQDAGDLPPLDD